ncbi:hypothetical protein [Microbulbifer litoralis]|uniref:hypothetical protein n=1 Tax=Microbulbifer litoralis TaxID=2933965 RepID=UPI002028C420|nr:hypothetical protein [Microbulbifer sp. GX H0434]
MNRKFSLILSLVFLVSVGVNVNLYREVQRFKEAWAEQFITTSEIEGILNESEADTSFENIQRLAIAKFGSESVRIVEVSDIHIDWGSDRKGLQVNGTLLLFKDGDFHGSKADLPLH